MGRNRRTCIKDKIPVKQDVPEERMEDPPSTDQPLKSGEASTTVEPTLQTNDHQFNPLIATHPTTDSVELRRSTRVKRPSFKLRSAFSVQV